MTENKNAPLAYRISEACDPAGDLEFNRTPTDRRKQMADISFETDNRILYPIPDACRVLGIGRTTLYGMINAGDLKTVKIRTRRLIVGTSILALVKRLGEAS